MKAFTNLILLSTLLLLAGCGSNVVNRAKLSAADTVGKYSKEFLQTQGLRDLGESDYKTLNCDEEAEVLSVKLRDGVDSALKSDREQDAIAFKSVSGDIIGLSCEFLMKQAIGIAVAGSFNDYKCAQKMFGNGLEKASGKLCPYIKSKLD